MTQDRDPPTGESLITIPPHDVESWMLQNLLRRVEVTESRAVGMSIDGYSA